MYDIATTKITQEAFQYIKERNEHKALKLIKSLEDVNISKSGKSLLHKAAELGSGKLINALVEKGANVNAIDRHKETPLHLAARLNKVDAINALIKAGANINATASYENTPLHLATQLNKVDAINALIKAGANVNATASYENTPLHLATQLNKVDAINALVKAGANLEAINTNGNTPLYTAAILGKVEAAKTLIENGANLDFSKEFTHSFIKKNASIIFLSPELNKLVYESKGKEEDFVAKLKEKYPKIPEEVFSEESFKEAFQEISRQEEELLNPSPKVFGTEIERALGESKVTGLAV